MKQTQNKLAVGTKSSVKVEHCQICNSTDLKEVISLGHIPQVNVMQTIGEDLKEELFFPCELIKCNNCSLVQISHIVDPEVIFPPEYAYTSRTTKILREGFAQLAKEVEPFLADINFETKLIVDIGSNDGTLLSNFKDKYSVLGVEPTNVAKYANEHGIPTMQRFFDEAAVNDIIKEHGYAKLITATNVFAHIENVHSIVDSIKKLMGDGGIFVNESHYLVGLLETNQYDTIYHEHLRYYSLTSLKYLLEMHGLEIFHATLIPTHGGSIRVYAANKGSFDIRQSVRNILDTEAKALTVDSLKQFKNNVINSKCSIYGLFDKVGGTIGAIGAPSRAMTLLNYIGLNEDIVKFILEAPGSNKIGKYAPGTKIPVLAETQELINSVDNLLLLSWHIADEIIPKLRAKGFKGKFITPLPYPKVIE